MVLIDWEYSGNNDFIWDLVYFALEAKLSRSQEMVLLGSYFDNVDEKIVAWFDLYKPVIEWWIAIWSWTQIANKANACDSEEYETLATTCYIMTNACLNSEEFKHAFALIEKETLQQSFAGMRGF
jgi:thiamine kinase-like enzyme